MAPINSADWEIVSLTADTVITVVLFVALVPLVVLACWMGFWEAMRGFAGKSSSTAYRYSFAFGSIGIPLFAIACYLIAVVLACISDGYTFYYPIIALIIGFILNRLLFFVADIYRKKYEDSADIWSN